jgi:DNA-directed RNA polymerase specialized sigma24 family protein
MMQAIQLMPKIKADSSEPERQAIVLRIELGLDYGEMATQLGKHGAEAARTTVTKAITRLAAEMRRVR